MNEIILIGWDRLHHIHVSWGKRIQSPVRYFNLKTLVLSSHIGSLYFIPLESQVSLPNRLSPASNFTTLSRYSIYLCDLNNSKILSLSTFLFEIWDVFLFRWSNNFFSSNTLSSSQNLFNPLPVRLPVNSKYHTYRR